MWQIHTKSDLPLVPSPLAGEGRDGGYRGSSTATGPLTLSLSGGAAGSAAHRPAACATKGRGNLYRQSNTLSRRVGKAHQYPQHRPGIEWWAVTTLVVTLFLPFPTAAQSLADTDPAVSAVYNALQPSFIPPAPGTYSLPAIDTVGDHQLLDSSGKSVSLLGLATGKVAVVSFMYTSCADVGGCPLAAAVLQQVDRKSVV